MYLLLLLILLLINNRQANTNEHQLHNRAYCVWSCSAEEVCTFVRLCLCADCLLDFIFCKRKREMYENMRDISPQFEPTAIKAPSRKGKSALCITLTYLYIYICTYVYVCVMLWEHGTDTLCDRVVIRPLANQ